MTVRYLIGDTRDVVAGLPDASVDLVLTSPPFLALRSYLPADHPDKGREIGSEPDPAAFIDTLLDLVEGWSRVIAPHGSIAVELGDTYSGSWAGQPDPLTLREADAKFTGSRISDRRTTATIKRNKSRDKGLERGWPLDKSLCLVPESFRWALAYGRNPFNGRTTDPWRVRNVVRWCRPNPPVGALGDKYRPATSEMVVACKSRTRWFDLDAVREPANPSNARSTPVTRSGIGGRADQCMNPTDADGNRVIANPAGAPPLDWWEIPTQPYSGSHYATWPERLCVRPILSMCPERVCTVCGEPSRRITEKSDDYAAVGRNWADADDGRGKAAGRERNNHSGQPPGARIIAADMRTLGWTDCGHDAWRRGVVLDPFGGSGTTGAVAEGLGRDSILIDLDDRNADLARERIGMFMETA